MNFNHYILARVIHILGIVLWIGGVAFVTTVLIPAIRKIKNHDDRFKLFESLEGRFSLQAKITTAFTGLSGLYMLELTNGWSRYSDGQFWWLHLMTFVWAIFTIVLFVLEPLFLHRWFIEQAQKDSEKTFAVIQTMHVVLLGLSLCAVAGGVAGAHGFTF